MKALALASLILLASAAQSVSQAQAQAQAKPPALILHYFPSPPLHYADAHGELAGYAARPALAALAAAGIPYQIRETAAKSQLVEMKANLEPACMLSWQQTPERGRIGKFSEVIYEDKRPFALTWAGNPAMHDERELKDTLGDKRLHAMVKEGLSYGPQIDRALLRYKTQPASTTADTQQQLQMLRQHRIDYFFITEEEAVQAIAASGTPASSYQRIYFSDLWRGHERRMWCTQSVPDDVFKRLNAAIVRLRR